MKTKLCFGITSFLCSGLWGWRGGDVLLQERRGASRRFPGQQGHPGRPGPFPTHYLPQLRCGVQLWPDGDSVLPPAPGLHLPAADCCGWPSPGNQGTTNQGWLRGKHRNMSMFFIDILDIFAGLMISCFCFVFSSPCCVDHSDGRSTRFREDYMGEEPCPGEPWKILHPGQWYHCGQDDGQYWYCYVVYC